MQKDDSPIPHRKFTWWYACLLVLKLEGIALSFLCVPMFLFSLWATQGDFAKSLENGLIGAEIILGMHVAVLPPVSVYWLMEAAARSDGRLHGFMEKATAVCWFVAILLGLLIMYDSIIHLWRSDKYVPLTFGGCLLFGGTYYVLRWKAANEQIRE